MSALDQAFIKAYSQQNPGLAPATVEKTTRPSAVKSAVKGAVSVEPINAGGAVAGAVKTVDTDAVSRGGTRLKRTTAAAKAAAKSTHAKKTVAAKGTKKPVTARHAARAPQAKTVKKPKAAPSRSPSESKTPDVTYRLDLPAMTSGSGSANTAVPAPHTDVIFSTRESLTPQQQSSSATAVAPSEPPMPRNPLPPKTPTADKRPAIPSRSAQPAANQNPPTSTFSEGWTADITRNFSNLDQPRAATNSSPEPAVQQGSKSPARIFESLSAGMKQIATHSVPLPEKTIMREKPEAAAQPPAIRLFQPMLQVDHFAWPKVCGRLESGANAELDSVIETLLAAQIRGKKVFVIGGCRAGDGATSLLLATARRLASQEMKVALVEGDWSQPQLARRLGLLPQYGWEDVLSGRFPLEEVLIESIAERLVILPVREPFGVAELPIDATTRLAETWNSLRHHFDIVLVDPGALCNSPILDRQLAGATAGRIDAALLVKNLRCHDAAEFDAVGQSLGSAGAKVVGIVENFVG
jgi:Mrp family chromosome partitioning ATPase